MPTRAPVSLEILPAQRWVRPRLRPRCRRLPKCCAGAAADPRKDTKLRRPRWARLPQSRRRKAPEKEPRAQKKPHTPSKGPGSLTKSAPWCPVSAPSRLRAKAVGAPRHTENINIPGPSEHPEPSRERTHSVNLPCAKTHPDSKMESSPVILIFCQRVRRPTLSQRAPMHAMLTQRLAHLWGPDCHGGQGGNDDYSDPV